MVVTVVNGGVLSEKETNEYIDRGLKKYGRALESVTITIISDEEVEIEYHLSNHPFERIRRITGYLIGTLDRWNDAKRAEEHDRVKHE